MATEVIRQLIDSGLDLEELSHRLGVSRATVLRWLDGTARPRPSLEGKLRALHAEFEADCSVPAAETGAQFESAVDQLLTDLRNTLHRRGRLSSRNEGLEEMAKLLFAHVMAVSEGAPGIGSELVETGGGAATTLARFVSDQVQSYLPASLEHEMPRQDFTLRLKPQEEDLAVEILTAFDKTRSHITQAQIIRGTDILNDVFGKFLADSFGDEKELGQYLTPTEVVQFMVQLAISDLDADQLELLVDPLRCTEFGAILDPSCGVASFLAEVLAQLQPKVAAVHGWKGAHEWAARMTSDVVVGIDKSERMIKLALANLAMFGFPAARLHLANALARKGIDGQVTSRLEGRVGLILTNPPFGAEFRESDLARFKIASEWLPSMPSKVDSEILFVERYLDWMKPGGSCLAVVPDSILTNRGIFETLRKELAPGLEIRSVTSLPAVTFGAAGTQTKTSVLHFRRARAVASRSRAFVSICRDIGFEVATRGSQRTKVKQDEGDLPKILRAYRSGGHQVGRRVAGLEAAARWDAGYHAGLAPEVEERLSALRSSDVMVGDVADLVNEREDPRRRGVGTFPYIEISDVDSTSLFVSTKDVSCDQAPSRARKVVRDGDVLVSTVRPERRTIGVVRADQDGSICTTGFAVLRPRKVDPMVLAALLRTDFVTSQILRNNIGIAYPAIDESCLLEILLPIATERLTAAEEAAQRVIEIEEQRLDARRRFTQSINSAVDEWSGSDRTTLDPKPHQSSRTKSRRQDRTRDSGERAQGSLRI